MHCVYHVEFHSFLVVDGRNKILPSSKILDALIGQIFFFAQFHDSGVQKLLLIKYLLLLDNRFHHVRGWLFADHLKARLHEFECLKI